MDSVEQVLQRTLVVRCQLGERRAIEELFLRHNRALGYYLRQTLSRDDIADVQQEVWLTVIRRIGQLRDPEAFVVWLYRIARNKAMTRLTKRESIASLDDEIAGDIREDSYSEFSPSDAARIHEKMAQLSDKHREVLTLRFVEDLSYEQIAEVIGCTAGTVRSRLHYAKAALRRLLENSYEHIHDA
jgi:RNA polymerase sigma-70 factor (ECF subfamily)